MKYLKTFESYSTVNEEFLDSLKGNIKQTWDKMKSEFSSNKFVEWTNQNLGEIINQDPELVNAAKNLGIDANSPNIYSEMTSVAKDIKNSPEGQKLASKAETNVEEIQGVVQEGFWKNVVKGILKFVGYGGLVSDFCLLIYAWMKAALGIGFYTSLFGASVPVGVVSVIVCIGLVVFGTIISIARSMRTDGGKSDEELNRW